MSQTILETIGLAQQKPRAIGRVHMGGTIATPPTFRVYVAESYRQKFKYRSGTSVVESGGVACDVYNKERLYLHLISLADYQVEPHNLVARHGIPTRKQE